jgi:hypothetical protein
VGSARLSSTIIGARRLTQLQDNVGSIDVPKSSAGSMR